MKVMSTASNVSYLNSSIREIWHVSFIVYYVYIHVFIYLYKYGFMDMQCILWHIIKCHIIFCSSCFNCAVWSTFSCVPLRSYHCFVFCSISCFMTLQDDASLYCCIHRIGPFPNEKLGNIIITNIS